MKPLIVPAALCLALLPSIADAQLPTEKTKEVCRETTRKFSRSIADAQKSRVDLRQVVFDERDNWAQGVINYMLLLAIDTPSLTQREIATMGYAYCIERRPSGR